MISRAIPDGLDAETTMRLTRTFLVVRLVRGSLFLLFLAIAAVAVEIREWPRFVTGIIVLAALAQAAALVVWVRRYRTAIAVPSDAVGGRT